MPSEAAQAVIDVLARLSGGAARRHTRPGVLRAPGHQPQGRRHAQHRRRCPAPGLTLPATFGASGDIVGGTATQLSTYNFTVQGTGDQGQPLYQPDQITVDPNQPLAIVLPASGSTLGPGTVGGAYAQNFFLSGGAGPYTWAVAAGQLPPGLTLQTFGDPRDASNELAGTPTTAGTFTFTMRLTDYAGHQATRQFSLTVDP